jgi:hypothetical protein
MRDLNNIIETRFFDRRDMLFEKVNRYPKIKAMVDLSSS